MWKLTIEDDQGNSIPVPLVRDDYSIGRGPENTLRLTERNVSRRHATLVRENGRWVLVDLDSYNGSYINGQRVAGRQVLEDGDLIQLGDYRLKIVEEAGAVAAMPEQPAEESSHETAFAGAAGGLDAPASWSTEPAAVPRSDGKKTGMGVAVGLVAALAVGGVIFAVRGSGSEPKVATTTATTATAKAPQQEVAAAKAPEPASVKAAAELEAVPADEPAVEVAEAIDLDDEPQKEEAAPQPKRETQPPASPVRVASAPAPEKPRTTQPAAATAPKPSAERKPVLAANPFDNPAPSTKSAPAPSKPSSGGGSLAALAAEGREGEAKMRPILEQRVARGTATEADIKLLRAICRNMGDRVCADKMTALLAKKN